MASNALTWRGRWRAWRMRRATRRAAMDIRRHMAALGQPIWDLTDQEIEEGLRRAAQIVAATGISAEEACRGLSALHNPQRTPHNGIPS